MHKADNDSKPNHKSKMRVLSWCGWLDVLAIAGGLFFGCFVEHNSFFNNHPLIMSGLFPVVIGCFFAIPEAVDSAANHEFTHPRMYKITHRCEVLTGLFSLTVGLGALIAHLHENTLMGITIIFTFFVVLLLFRYFPARKKHKKSK